MPSAKQIKARKAFARKYAKKGKRKAKSKIPKSTAVPPITTQTKKQAVRTQIKELKRTGTWNEKWDKRMQEFLNKSNNES